MVNEIENTYEFEVELEDGTKEILKVSRLTTRSKYRLGMKAFQLEKADQDDMGILLIDAVLPGLLDRKGGKSVTVSSLMLLTGKIFEMDGENLFGKDWQKKVLTNQVPEVKKKRGRKKKG